MTLDRGKLASTIMAFLVIGSKKSQIKLFAYAKTKTQISCAVTAKLISAFVFATWIVQSLFYLNPKFQASSHLLWLYRPICVGPGRKPRRPVFSQRGSNQRRYEVFVMRLNCLLSLSMVWVCTFCQGLSVTKLSIIMTLEPHHEKTCPCFRQGRT